MKLTWFGGTTLRVYLGGEIVLVDAEGAPEGVDRGELLAGADRVVALAGDPAVPSIDPADWRPKPAPRQIDAPPPLEILAIGASALLLAAAGEPPLVLLGSGEPPRFGRWADGAVVVLTSGRESFVAEATVLLDVARNIAQAIHGLEVDETHVVDTIDTRTLLSKRERHRDRCLSPFDDGHLTCPVVGGRLP